MEVKVDNSVLQAALTKAMLEAIPQEEREKLLVEAIQHIMGKDRYDTKGGTVLEACFRRVVIDACEEAARDVLEKNPKYKEQLRLLVARTAESFFSRIKERALKTFVEKLMDGTFKYWTTGEEK